MTDQETWEKIREEKAAKQRQRAAAKESLKTLVEQHLEPPAWAQKIQKQGGNILL